MPRLYTAAAALALLPAAALGVEQEYADGLRPDGERVRLLSAGEAAALFPSGGGDQVPFKPFPDAYVAHALVTGVDWAASGHVTPAKDQGRHGYCGTFSRVAVSESQYALRSGRGLRNFSEEMLVDCPGWTGPQFAYVKAHGHMSEADYPYRTKGPGGKPPIPGYPCMFNASEVIEGTVGAGTFEHEMSAHPSEDQLAAFVFKNGPIGIGIHAQVFGKRAKGCEHNQTCFVTADGCAAGDGPVNHAVVLVGFGTHPEHGAYWKIKNSWSHRFANDGFIYVARGVRCGRLHGGHLSFYGEPASYFL
eukprot:TRINITY_DN2205_c0_g2_i3.p1 TRINITY_DN2205_c0_g2~~TRINITY_DN2205_c0_g2_i3.p1  ORF type:complete len:305 (+),score=96.95 TRINITY_DN2205_c0_g2_i3:59-973(+)